jgi:hypothetical protein
MRRFRFSPALPQTPAFTVGDGLIILGIAAFLYVGTRLAFHAPSVISGPEISISPLALPWLASCLPWRCCTVHIARRPCL